MNSKVISFDYSAAYAYAGAMRCMRENNKAEALELLRQAVEKAPKNREYRFSLEQQYREVNQLELSDSILLDMLSEKDANAECFFRLAMNQALCGNEDYAKLALTAYGRRIGDTEQYRDAVDEIMDILDDDLPAHMEKISIRRTRREKRKLERDPLTRDRTPSDCVIEMFEQDPTGEKTPPIMRYFYVTALLEKGERARAGEAAKQLANDTRMTAIEMTVSAQMLLENGFREEAGIAARQVLKMDTEDVVPELLEHVFLQADMPEELALCCKLFLQRMPYEKKYLHMRAVALHRSGAADLQAASCWYKITQVDPYDAVADYWLKIAREGSLSKAEPEYSYTVPSETEREWYERIVKASSAQEENSISIDREMRKVIAYALRGQNSEQALKAAALLAEHDDAESVNMLREYLYRNTTNAQTREAVRRVLIGRGADIGKRFPMIEVDPEERLPQLKELMHDLPVSDRQLIRFTDDALRDHYYCAAGAALWKMWNRYKSAEDANRMESTQEAAAALAWNYLLSIGMHPNIDSLAKQFKCSIRRMTYYARHMAAVLEGCACNEDH